MEIFAEHGQSTTEQVEEIGRGNILKSSVEKFCINARLDTINIIVNLSLSSMVDGD